MSDDIRAGAEEARAAALVLAQSTEADRNGALEAIAAALEENAEEIFNANHLDLEAGNQLMAEGKLTEPLVHRLKLDAKKLPQEVVVGVRSVRDQEDPIGKTQMATELDEGLNLYRVSVPIGVIGVVFESRPDALVQIACLCLKSGNAVLLKGGSEALHSNRVLAQIMQNATRGLPGIPQGWMHLLEAREEVQAILDLHHLVDLLIPRGGNDLVQHIMNNTKIPVMGHADGICHVYVDAEADAHKARRICLDSKTQYPAVCNAAETILVHSELAEELLPDIVRDLVGVGVEVRGDEATQAYGGGRVKAASEADWATEYLDLIVSIKVVSGLEEAIDHINRFSSHHTDAIVTEDGGAAERFLRAVDSASALHNASTRFADGFRYGLGAELGISTNRLHSRGPVGLEGLVIYKYVLEGGGHIVGDYSGDNARTYSHRRLNSSWKRGR
ncbi:MAG: glutamate-5-semialdehyde dehydrogenase [Gemmatimonadetes bacterium]|nr:glutamate-5-semialdehyde dehydrogenase [Gemmatimonadota bacterium]